MQTRTHYVEQIHKDNILDHYFKNILHYRPPDKVGKCYLDYKADFFFSLFQNKNLEITILFSLCPGVLQFNYKTLKVNQKFALSMKSLVVFVDILIIIFGFFFFLWFLQFLNLCWTMLKIPENTMKWLLPEDIYKIYRLSTQIHRGINWWETRKIKFSSVSAPGPSKNIWQLNTNSEEN